MPSREVQATTEEEMAPCRKTVYMWDSKTWFFWGVCEYFCPSKTKLVLHLSLMRVTVACSSTISSTLCVSFLFWLFSTVGNYTNTIT